MSAGPMETSDVDSAAEAPQGGLTEGLGQGWVGVDGPGHVLEKCPHFDRQCELSSRLRVARHQTAVTGDVRGKDRGEFASHRFDIL